MTPASPARGVVAGSPLNLPNTLTIGRFLLVAPIVVLLSMDANGSLLVASLFCLAAVTDGLDGHLARSRGAVTRLGTVMDPLADKLLILPVLLTLVLVDRLAAWVAIVVLVRELAVSGLRLAAGRHGKIIEASALGKAKMTAQVGTVAVLLAVPDAGAGWVEALVYATVLVTVVSGLDYFLSYLRAGRAAARPASPPARPETVPLRPAR